MTPHVCDKHADRQTDGRSAMLKAFDKMNHQGRFIKQMERGLPEKVLLLLENWFDIDSAAARVLR